jgi:Secretion system C-terminal sorting domain/Glycosyl hydrolase family 79 C-terminal beta domain
MKAITILFCGLFLLARPVLGQSSVTITVDIQHPGSIIPDDFSGVSFGTISLKKGSMGYFFDSTNTQALTLFQILGIKNLRVGGTSVDTNNSAYVPDDQDIDALFRFARAAGITVIYSLRLLNGDSLLDASTAKYIRENYSQYLDCFAIGNEPDTYDHMDPDITNYSSYLTKWRKFAAAIIDSVPDAKFCGPDGGSGTSGAAWGTNFAFSETNSGIISFITFHDYVGGSSASKTPQQLIDEMLAPTWDASTSPTEYNASGGTVMSIGFSYRFTEANSYFTGGGAGVAGGNNCCATALFALDYMHWWSLHNIKGVNFHTSMWKYNGTFYQDASGNYQVYPMGYGIKAFDIGGHGTIMPVTITNPDNLDLTAYAVDDSGYYYITLINKEHDSGARSANVEIAGSSSSANDSIIYLMAPGGNLSATTGMTLGGATINNSGSWQGNWSSVDSVDSASGNYIAMVPAGSAAIFKVHALSVTQVKTAETPSGFSLRQNFPNPFNPSTAISFNLNHAGVISLRIYNVLGQLIDIIAQGYKTAGEYTYTVNMKGFSSGLYFYTLRQGTNQITKKMLLLQ